MPVLLYFWLLVTVIVFLTLFYFRQLYQFWRNVKVPHTTPRFPLGDIQNGGWAKYVGLLYKEIYEKFSEERYCGIWMFVTPILLVRDPELIKTILVKDFSYFRDRGIYYNEKNDPLSAHMFAIEGLKWKNIRIKLSPTFTSAKMKMMFPLIIECGTELKEVLKEPARRRETVDAADIASRFTTDGISLCAFGIKTNSLKNSDAEFRKLAKKTTEANLRNIIIFLIQICCPKLLKLVGARVFYKEVSDYFLKAIRDVMEYREKNPGKVPGNDFLQLLIQLKTDGHLKDVKKSNGEVPEVGERLTFEEAAAQAFVFFIAGSETSSSTLMFALYEIAKNLHIQEKLRSEILKGLSENEGKLTYDLAHNIPYLDKVIDETLRKYPIVPMLVRQCNKNYKIPNSDVIVPKDTLIHIPVYGLHMDEKYYPEPEKFDPERFSDEKKQTRHAFAYLPFGEGPRNCIGKRFGHMQVRVGLIILLLNYKLQLSEESKGPMTFDPKAFFLMPKDKLMIKISPL